MPTIQVEIIAFKIWHTSWCLKAPLMLLDLMRHTRNCRYSLLAILPNPGWGMKMKVGKYTRDKYFTSEHKQTAEDYWYQCVTLETGDPASKLRCTQCCNQFRRIQLAIECKLTLVLLSINLSSTHTPASYIALVFLHSLPFYG